MTLCALVAAPSILLGPALVPGRVLLPADLLVQFEPWRSQLPSPPQAHWDALVWDGIAQYYPWRRFASESLRAGHLPLWNPYQFCGTPFLANGQSAVLYPLNLLFWLLPVARAFAISAWLHLALAGWFAYLFLRRIGAGRVGAVSAGVVWQMNSFFVAWLHLPTVICSASWLPLILLSCDRAIVTGRSRHAIAAGSALALSYLGGHPQVFLFVALLTGTYLVARGFNRSARQGLAPAQAVLRVVRTALIAGSLSLGLSAAQLLPTLDLLRVAHRAFTPGPESYKAFLSRALPVPLLSNLVLPHPFGHPDLGTYVGPENYAEYCSYIGIVALAFALYAALTVRSWHARFFAAAAVLAVLVAVGTPLNWPLYRWLPGMSGAGGPARMVLVAVFSLSMLAGLGVGRVCEACLPRSVGQELAPALILILLALVAALWGLMAGPALSERGPTIARALTSETTRALILTGIALMIIFAIRRAGPSAALRVNSDVPALQERSLGLRNASGAVMLALLAADLLIAAQHHPHIVPEEWVYSAKANPGPVAGRVLGNAADWPLDRFPRAVLPPNAATVYHLRDAFGYDSLYLARYRDFASLIQGEDPSPPANGNLLLARLGATHYGLDMMSLAGVTAVLSPGPVRGLRLNRAGAFETWRNPYARSRAWSAESSVALPSHGEAVAALTRLGGYGDLLVITGADEAVSQLPAGPRATARVRDLSPNQVVADLPQGGGGYLFLADSYAPGWHAYVVSSAGSQPAELPILIADVTFRAVAPPREAKMVDFRYEPASFGVGLFLSLVALAALTLALGFVVTTRRT